MNVRAFACAALILISSVTAASANEADSEFPIAVEVTGVERSQAHIYLDMLVWNCSDKQLTMDRFILPWGATIVRGLVIYHAYSGKTLEQSYPIEDFPEQVYTIPGGGSVAGRIDLNWYFVGLSSLKDLKGFVIFWVYQPRGKSGAPVGKKFGGMVPLDSGLADAPHRNPCRPRDESGQKSGASK